MNRARSGELPADRLPEPGMEPAEGTGVIRLPLWVIVAGLGVALAVRVPGVAEPLWEDEIISTWLAHHPLSRIPAVVAYHDTHPPLYFAILHVWFCVFGDSDLKGRALSLLIGLATVLVCARIALYWWGHRAGTAAVILTAAAPGLVYMSQEVRNQIPLALLCLLSVQALERCVRRPTLVSAAAYGVVAAASFYTHYLAGPLLAALNIAALAAVWRRWGPHLRAWVVGNILMVGLVLPWLSVVRRQAEVVPLMNPRLGPAGLQSALESSAAYLAGVDPARSLRVAVRTVLPTAAADYSAAGMVILLLGLGLYLSRRADRREWAVLALAGPVGTAVGMGLLHGLRGAPCHARYFPMFSPLLLLCVAFVMSRLPRGLFWAGLSLLVALQAAVLSRTVRHAVDPWPDTVAWLTQYCQPPPLVLSARGAAGVALRRYGYPGPVIHVPFELPGLEASRRRFLAGLLTLEPQDRPRLDRVLAGHSRFWLVTWSRAAPDPWRDDPVLREYLGSHGWRTATVHTVGTAQFQLMVRPGRAPASAPKPAG